jgi:hypothetical protein
VAPKLQKNIFLSRERRTKIMHKRIISAVQTDEFVSDRMSHIILRGRWCHIIVLNVHVRIKLIM